MVGFVEIKSRMFNHIAISLMTPKWIDKNANITGPKALYPQCFEILPTTGVHFQPALQIQLVAPNILKSTEGVTVTVTVAVDVSYASNNDHDPFIGISDGQSFIGYKQMTKILLHALLNKETAVL